MNTNTNLATDLPCQPNTKATNTNPATNDDEGEDVEKLLELFTKDHLVALIKKGMSKHPDLIEIMRELTDADPTHHKIFIHDIGWDTTVKTLTSVFSKYSQIEDCKAFTDCVSGKSKGYTFILFKQRCPEGSQAALEADRQSHHPIAETYGHTH